MEAEATMALILTAAMVVATVVYRWFVRITSVSEVKGELTADLKIGSIVYEWLWGQSFHFSPSVPGKSHRDAGRMHEERIVDLLRARAGQKIVDVGCGVGGPMRTIAAKSRANVVGVTISEHQVARAQEENKKARVDSVCDVICSDFLSMPFKADTFDGAYSIEATCHAPKLDDVYAEIFRVLKPGGLYVSYESVTTELYSADDPEHVETVRGIKEGAALPELRTYKEISETARRVGFEVVEERDLARPPAGPWWPRLKMGRIAYWRNRLLLVLMITLRIAPKGMAEMHEIVVSEMAADLFKGGETGIFTPMYMILCRKPLLMENN